MTREEYREAQYNKNHKIVDGIIYKKCSDCKEFLPMNDEYFYKTKYKSDGYTGMCKKCNIKRSCEYESKHKKEQSIRTKRWTRENKEHHYQLNKQWKENHKEAVRKYNDQYRKSEHGKAKFRKYGQRRKHDITNQEWDNCKKYFNYKCACCGLDIKNHYVKRKGELKLFDFHKDHVICDGKNDLSNCIPLCNHCNNRKKKKTINQFYNPKNHNYTYERYHKIYLWVRYDYKKYILPKKN